jgi:glycine/D-amino acid oxidase-like deaminating enzyme
VVVVGASFAGLSAARRLKQLDKTLKVVVLDALRLGEGSAGRNSGFMIDLPHDLASSDYTGSGEGDGGALTVLNRQAIDFALAAAADYDINPAYVDLAGKVNGAVGAAGDKRNRAYARHLGLLGERSAFLDAQEMRALTGSAHYTSGVFTPGTLMLQPAGYIRGLAAGLRRDGVQVCEDTPVTGFGMQGRGWLVETTSGRIKTGRVILATNGHLESFGLARGHLMQLFLFASMTPDLDADQLQKLGGSNRWGVTPADPMGTTLRRIDTPQGGNRIITRTCAVLRPGMTTSQADVQRAARIQAKKFDQRFPQLKGISMQYQWAGHLCMTRNGVSVTREIGRGVFPACAQNGLGTARGTLTGIAAAEAAMGHRSAITDYFEAEEHPKPLPPQPMATWGANTYLRWKEWRAGAE